MGQINRFVRSTVFIGAIAALAVLFAVQAWAAEEETPAQRNACTPDVFRLCSNFIPDRDAITACLQRNTPKLNPACRAVFQAKK